MLADRAGHHAAVQVERIPEFDGLRGVAILLVVFAHVMSGIWPAEHRALAPRMLSMGGLAGVQLFFVLSGLLITRILLAEQASTGRIGLPGFYLRRLQRLYPSLLVVAAFVWWLGDGWSAFRALTYTSNWLFWDAFGRDTLQHSWSLAVEEQFYLLWPALLALSGRRAGWVAAAGICATLVAQFTVAWSTRGVYYGLRWDALLAGCTLALAPVRGSPRLLVAGLAVLGALTLGVLGEVRPEFYPLTTVACVCVVASAQGAGWLAAPWLAHIGRLSYALYLWHGVILKADIPMYVSVPVSFLLAEATWRLVDKRAQTRRTFPVKQEAR